METNLQQRTQRSFWGADGEPLELSFYDYPMFDAVMTRRHDLCHMLAETIVGEDLGQVVDVVSEYSIEPALGARGVRMDALLRTTGALIDVEMQTYSRSCDLGRRLRYYQGAMDVGELRKGYARTDGGSRSMTYDELPRSFIVFICREDPLGLNLPVYTFDVTCTENPSVDLGHGFRWIVLNASAWNSLPDGRLRAVLHYVATNVDDGADELVAGIDAECTRLNADAVWRREGASMLTMQEDFEAQMHIARRYAIAEGRRVGLAEGLAEGREVGLAEGRKAGLAEGREAGLAEGRVEGEQRMGALMTALLKTGRTDDIPRATEDAAYRDQLFQEFGL